MQHAFAELLSWTECRSDATTVSSGCTRPVPPLHMYPQGGQALSRGPVAEGLVGPDGVVHSLPGPEILRESLELGLGGGDLVELLGMGPVGPLDGAMELGGARRQDEQADARASQAASNSAINSDPLSMLMARTPNLIRSARRSRTAVAAGAVARRPSSSTSQRETTSRAVNCFQILAGRGRMSRVSSSTRSPGRSTAQPAGRRIAEGRGQRRRWTPIRRRAGVHSSPVARRRPRIRPTMLTDS